MLAERHNYRLEILAVIIVLIFVALISRLTYLQVLQGPYYARLADGNRIKLIPIMAPRGIFYDRNSVPLVSNRPGFAVSMVLLGGKPQDEVIRRLAVVLNMDVQEIRKKLEQNAGSFEPVRIKSDIGQDVVTRIEERRDDFPGVVIEIQPIRNYVNGEMGAHVFGYVSEINDVELEKRKKDGYKAGDIIGKFGLEYLYDRQLRGSDGGGQVEVDVNGRPVQVLGKKEPVPGENLVLTLDYRIQKAAEEAVDAQMQYLQTKTEYYNAKAAAAVVVNPKTGEILAMVSRPGFNPNLFAGGISSKEWNKLNENPFHPMDNKAIAGEYAPGSTFKVVTGAAALELGKVTPEEKILDTGQHWIIDKKNAAGEALGWINFREALSQSDNVYFYEMGNRLGIDNLEKYARLFGLGDYTGINLPGESDGLVANRKYKEKVYNEDWYLSETFDAAIGQGFQLTTPLQMAMVYSQIANGGHRYQPYLVSRITNSNGDVLQTFQPKEVGQTPLSAQNMKLIQDSLRDVALEGGTAAYEFRDFPIPVSGKTGTAENSHGKDHGWFVAYAPYEDPRIVVVVIVEQGGFGATASAPIAKHILEAAFNINQDAAVAGPRIVRPGTAL